MKTRLFRQWSVGMALAMLPFVGGCDQETAALAPVLDSADNLVAVAPADTETNNSPTSPAADTTIADLENAPAKVVSTAEDSAPEADLTAPALSVARLAQSGVGENVMLTYVTNSTNVFGLTADDIIYLSDIGVPDSVVTAMMQHDEAFKVSHPEVAQAPAPAAPVPAETQYPTPPATLDGLETAAPEPAVATVELPSDQPANVSYNYFYDSLAPYGNWIDVGGYGLCWHPSVAVVNSGWQPYCNRGHWAYTDCGWYWNSDYSWGWAPFHYGRWFHHQFWGWCWAPDTVWSPAWVSWRYTPSYCGWAPLPPTACYTPGFGFSFHNQWAGFDCDFGIYASWYTVVPIHDFCDHHLDHHRIPPEHRHDFFRDSKVHNDFARHGSHLFNKGVPVERVAQARHSEIVPVHLRDTDRLASVRTDRVERDGRRDLTVYRPHLPEPTNPRTHLVGQSVRADNRIVREVRESSSQRRSGTVREFGATGMRHVRNLGQNTPSVASSTPATERPRMEARNERAASGADRISRSDSGLIETRRDANGTTSWGPARQYPRGSLILRGANRQSGSVTEIPRVPDRGTQTQTQPQSPTQTAEMDRRTTTARYFANSRERSAVVRQYDRPMTREVVPARQPYAPVQTVPQQAAPVTPDVRSNPTFRYNPAERIQRSPGTENRLNFRQSDQRVFSQPSVRVERQVQAHQAAPVRQQPQFTAPARTAPAPAPAAAPARSSSGSFAGRSSPHRGR